MCIRCSMQSAWAFLRRFRSLATCLSWIICRLTFSIALDFLPFITCTHVFNTCNSTQITFELYERNRGLGDDTPLEYSLRIGFSPGAHDPGYDHGFGDKF